MENKENNSPSADNAGVDVAAAEPSTKERVIFALKSLVELVANDQIRASQIEGLTTAEIIALAESEAAKAVDGAGRLANS